MIVGLIVGIISYLTIGAFLRRHGWTLHESLIVSLTAAVLAVFIIMFTLYIHYPEVYNILWGS